jgi:hypothetical protein
VVFAHLQASSAEPYIREVVSRIELQRLREAAGTVPSFWISSFCLTEFHMNKHSATVIIGIGRFTDQSLRKRV